MANIWVDGTLGNDSTGDGSFPNPYLTVGAAATAASNGDTVKIMAGTYSASGSHISGLDKSLVFEGKGFVKITGSSSPRFISTDASQTATRNYRFKNLFFSGLTVVDHQNPNPPFTVNLFFDNCAALNSPLFVVGHNILGNVTPINPTVQLQNNTVVGALVINAVASDAVLTVIVDLHWERNNIYDMNQGSPASSFSAASGTIINRNNADYNAVTAGDILGGHDFSLDTGNFPPLYIDVSSNLALRRGTNPKNDSPYAPTNIYNAKYIGTGGAGGGEFGDDIGASFYRVSTPTDTPDFYVRSAESPSGTYFPETWTATPQWKNDELWRITLGPPGPGVDAIAASEGANASPGIVSTDADKRIIVDTSTGGGISARVISPVFDTTEQVVFKGVSFFGLEDLTLGGGNLETIDSDTTGPNRTIEYRYSNVSFPDSGPQTPGFPVPTAWATLRRIDMPIAIGQFWQFRVTIRANGAS